MGVETGGVAHAEKSQWPGSGPPADGNEYDARAYVLLDPNKSYQVKGNDTKVNFVDCLIRLELYTRS